MPSRNWSWSWSRWGCQGRDHKCQLWIQLADTTLVAALRSSFREWESHNQHWCTAAIIGVSLSLALWATTGSVAGYPRLAQATSHWHSSPAITIAITIIITSMANPAGNCNMVSQTRPQTSLGDCGLSHPCQSLSNSVFNLWLPVYFSTYLIYSLINIILMFSCNLSTSNNIYLYWVTFSGTSINDIAQGYVNIIIIWQHLSFLTILSGCCLPACLLREQSARARQLCANLCQGHDVHNCLSVSLYLPGSAACMCVCV